MRPAATFRLVTLATFFVVIGLVWLFLWSARRFGQSQMALDDLPESVLRALEGHVEERVAFVQVDRKSLGERQTYLVRLWLPNGPPERLWLAADGTRWPPNGAGRADVR